MDDWPKDTLDGTAYTSAPNKKQFQFTKGNLEVYALDKLHSHIHEIWFCEKAKCSFTDCPHDSERWTHVGKDFCTVDALCEARDGTLCFIEFKNRPSSNLTQEELWEKAFETPYAVFLAMLEEMPMRTFRQKAELFVVFKDLSAKTDEAYRAGISAPIKRLAKETDAQGKPVYFGLTVFRGKLYRDVHTFSAQEFDEWATQNLP